MANEIKVLDSKDLNVVNEVVDSKEINISKLVELQQSSYIKMRVYCEMQETDGNRWNKVKAFMFLPCYDINGKYLGKFNRWLEVHFRRDAFKKSKDSNVSDIEDIVSGDLYVYAKDVDAPRKYQPKYAKDKDGNVIIQSKGKHKGEPKVEYPTIWIQGGIIGNIPFVASQDAFDKPSYEDVEIANTDVAYDDSSNDTYEE